MKEGLRWRGRVTILKKRGDKVISKKVIYNLITNVALNEIIKAFYSDPDMQLKYLAIGTGNTAAAAGDTTLETEIFRTPILTKYVSGTGELTSRAVLLDTDPFEAPAPPSHDQCIIKEIGFFAGTTAMPWNDGAGIDTGTLISRIVLTSPETKADNEQIQFSREDLIERG